MIEKFKKSEGIIQQMWLNFHNNSRSSIWEGLLTSHTDTIPIQGVKIFVVEEVVEMSKVVNPILKGQLVKTYCSFLLVQIWFEFQF